MKNATLINEKITTDYKMSVYETKKDWGVITSYVFIRYKNVSEHITLRTVVNHWRDKENRYRTSKQFQIVKKDEVLHSIWANIRYDKETGKESYANASEIKNFFTLFDLEKRLYRLEGIVQGTRQD